MNISKNTFLIVSAIVFFLMLWLGGAFYTEAIIGGGLVYAYCIYLSYAFLYKKNMHMLVNGFFLNAESEDHKPFRMFFFIFSIVGVICIFIGFFNNA